jgi:hypothetical protein
MVKQILSPREVCFVPDIRDDKMQMARQLELLNLQQLWR